MTTPLSLVSARHVSTANAEQWSAAQAAAVAAAEAIAATAAAEVAAEAAITAQSAVDVALEAAQKAAAKATEVAARAALAAAAAAAEAPGHLTPAEQHTHVEGLAKAADKVALCVQAVAAAASTAAAEAAAVVAEQSASDIAATAAAVTFATSQPVLIGEPSIDCRTGGRTAAGCDATNARPTGATMNDPEGRAAAGTEMCIAFESARAVGYAAGSPQMLALVHAEDRWALNKRAEPDAR